MSQFKYVTLVHCDGNITWRQGEKHYKSLREGGYCKDSRVLTPPKRLRNTNSNHHENTYKAVDGGKKFNWWLYKEAVSWAKEIGGRVVHDRFSVDPVASNSLSIPNAISGELPDVSSVEKWHHFDSDYDKDIFSISPGVMSPDWPEDSSTDRIDVLLERMSEIEEESDDDCYVYCIRFVKDSEPSWYIGETINLKQRIRTHSHGKRIVGVEEVEVCSGKIEARERERELAYEKAIEHESTNICGGR